MANQNQNPGDSLLDREGKTDVFWELTPALCSQMKKIKLSQKKKHSFYCVTWEGAQLCFELALLHLACDDLNLCITQ